MEDFSSPQLSLFFVIQGLAAILGKFDDKPIVINNNLTRYYDNCERYNVEVDDDPETAEEEQKFANGTEMRTLARMLSDRLQINVPDLTSGVCDGCGWWVWDIQWWKIVLRDYPWFSMWGGGYFSRNMHEIKEM